MIYLVTTQSQLFENTDYKIIGVEESLRLLSPLTVVGVDSETKGLDPHTGKLLSLQLGNKEFQIVIDCTTISITRYKEYLESDRLFIFWNARFDLKWLFKYHIVPINVYDGMLAEKLMWLGYPTVLSPEVWYKIKEERYDYVPASGTKKPYYIIYMNLKKAAHMYLGVELDKSIRGQIIYKGLDTDVIKYAAEDVEHLEDIMTAQIEKLKEQDLITAMQYECKFIIPLAYMEYCGVKIDIPKWKQKMAKDESQLNEVVEKMNKWLIDNDPNNKYIYIDKQGDLFSESTFDLSPKVSLNWNSGKQMIPIFKKFGINVTIDDKGDEKDSINEKVLAPQADKCSLIPLYLEFKGLKKLVSTYGQNLLKQINNTTGRLYTNWNPIGTDTGRISSGGKDKENGVEYINFLNFPSDAFTRSCFIAEDGNKWISIDYAGQESFIMADISNDEAILHELNHGDKDLHTLTAKIIFPYIPKDMSAKEVKKKFHDERDKAKRYEFAFNYAGNDFTIKRNFGLTNERALEIYNSYMNGFEGLKKYQEMRKKDWWKKGYILLSPITKYRAHIYDYQYLKSQYSSFQEDGFWDYYKEMKNSCPTCETVSKVKDFFKRRADTDRQSVNYPIQHIGAACYKVSMINFFKWLKDKDYLFKALITITPYDK